MALTPCTLTLPILRVSANQKPGIRNLTNQTDAKSWQYIAKTTQHGNKRIKNSYLYKPQQALQHSLWAAQAGNFYKILDIKYPSTQGDRRPYRGIEMAGKSKVARTYNITTLAASLDKKSPHCPSPSLIKVQAKYTAIETPFTPSSNPHLETFVKFKCAQNINFPAN